MNISLVNDTTEPFESFSVVLESSSDLVNLEFSGESSITILDDDCELSTSSL